MKSSKVKKYTDPQLMKTSAAGPVMSARPTPTLYPAETRLSTKVAMSTMMRRRGETEHCEQGRFMLSSLTATSKILAKYCYLRYLEKRQNPDFRSLLLRWIHVTLPLMPKRWTGRCWRAAWLEDKKGCSRQSCKTYVYHPCLFRLFCLSVCLYPDDIIYWLHSQQAE